MNTPFANNREQPPGAQTKANVKPAGVGRTADVETGLAWI